MINALSLSPFFTGSDLLCHASAVPAGPEPGVGVCGGRISHERGPVDLLWCLHRCDQAGHHVSSLFLVTIAD